MKKLNFILFLLIGLNFSAQAQMVVGNQKLYGNEWIDYTQTYIKIPVAQDGIYRLTASALQTAGIPLSTITANRFQLFNKGQEVTIYTTTEAAMASTDYIEFFGEKNRGELDAFMYKNQKQDMLNPEYSLMNDTAAYFLTWRVTPSTKRFQTIANNLTNLPAKDAWFWHTDMLVGKEREIPFDISGGSHVYLPEMNNGEGYGLEFSNNKIITLNPEFIADGQVGKLTLRWTANERNHFTTIKVSGDVVGRDTSYGFSLKEKTFDLTTTQIKAGMPVQITGGYEAADFNSIGVATVQYARQFNFGGKNQFIFKIAASTSVKYLEITNFLSGTTAPVLYDVTNKLRLVTTLEGGIVKVALPASTSDCTLVLVADNAITTATANRISFVDLKTDGGNYIMVSNAKFFNDGTGKNYVQDYANYRASTEGGSFKSTVVDVQQVYDQFGYGVNRHQLSLRNFAFYIKKNWANPQYMVLVGKAKEFSADRSNVAFADKSDMPTWGFPGSDQMFVTNDSSVVPIFPIGRIPLTVASELKIYLDKVKEHESVLKNAPQTLVDRQWMKNIIHLGGGGEQGPIIKEYLKNFADTIQASKAGLNVTSFYKTSLDPVQVALNNQIFEYLNKGASLVTFYGHSATSVLDFDINSPDFMTNKGKYPVFIALGCSAGNCHQQAVGIAENFIFYKDKGMSAFIGTTGSSFLNSLNRFTTAYYSTLGNVSNGVRLGDIAKMTFTQFSQGTVQNDLGLKSAIQEYQITGDPALRYFAPQGQDYLLDAASVKLEPSILTPQLDSFAVTFNVNNIGITSKDSMIVLIRQQLPNNTFIELAKRKIAVPAYQSSFTWRVPMSKEASSGLNRLHIFVDSDNTITELPAPSAEGNNELVTSSGEKGVPFYILDNTVKPVYPTEFAIVNKLPIVLKASTSNALAKPQNYIIELDTTANFNSPLKKRTVINQLGGILKWQPDMNWINNTVYYWRTAADSTVGFGYTWQLSSFIYLSGGSEGWNQSHFYQMRDNNFSTLTLNDYDRKFVFGKFNYLLDLRYSLGILGNPTIYIQNSAWNGNPGSPSAGMFVLVLDSLFIRSLDKKIDLEFKDYGVHPQQFIFKMDDSTTLAGRKGMIDFLNKVPENSKVIIYSILQSSSASFQSERWANDSSRFGINLFRLLEKEGAKLVRNLANGTQHYAIAYKKGRGLLAENIGNYELGAPISFFMDASTSIGSMQSKIIGPAKEWQSLELKYVAEQVSPQKDSIYFDVFGLSADKTNDTLLLKKISNSTTSLSSIDAKKYPYLKLNLYASDVVDRTPPQLNYWRVLYKGVTELAVNPNAKFSIYQDTIQQGEQFKIDVNVENISNIDADSVLIRWTLRNDANVETNSFTKYAPLNKDGSFVASFTKNTKDMNGKNAIALEVNPNMVQPEQYTFNNYLQSSFYVDKDKKNPLLDVTFDGIRIMNNDIISPKSLIMIELRDENKFLALNDTALFKLFVQNQAGVKQAIFFNDPAIKFNPATITTTGLNKASIEYRPVFKTDGIYTLIIKAKDASGNASGDIDYSIAFQIITKSSISNILNYPNPFSTQTQFVYTLTGETPPTYFKIQIMTVSGKVVREITQDELGALKIGTHRTDYVWKGVDEYGNQLANGVYLYRIIAKNADGKAFENYEGDKTSEYFNKGIGKLVIMR